MSLRAQSQQTALTHEASTVASLRHSCSTLASKVDHSSCLRVGGEVQSDRETSRDLD